MESSGLVISHRDQFSADLAKLKDVTNFNLNEGTELYLIKQFYPQPEADLLYDNLIVELNWQEEHIVIFNKSVKVPRLMCWYGEPEAYYRYSGIDHIPQPWTQTLLTIKTRIETQCQASFNSVLANLYRDGQDSMGRHSDNEKELGENPLIASLSLGAARIFRMQHKKPKRSPLSITLGHGDLLVMGGTCQQHWLHSVPKTAATKMPRINLTFRKIIPA